MYTFNRKKNAEIDFEALEEIQKVTSKPLVLHGGSGIPIAIRQKLAAQTNICKFNIGTELRMQFGQSLRKTINENPDEFDRINLLNPTIPAMKELTRKIISDLRNP